MRNLRQVLALWVALLWALTFGVGDAADLGMNIVNKRIKGGAGVTLPDMTDAAITAQGAGDTGNLLHQNTDLANRPRGVIYDTGKGFAQLLGNAVNVYEFCDDTAAHAAKTCLDDAVADLGSTNPHAIIIPDPQTIPATLTTTSNLTLVFLGSGRLDPDAGTTTTINGPIVVPPNKQIFGGSGDVVFGSGFSGSTSVQWWGALADGSTNNQAAIQNAIDGTPSSRDLVFPANSSSYNVTGQITIDKAMTVRAYGATLNFPTNSANQGVKITASNVNIFGATITGPQYASYVSTQAGIFAYGADSSNYITGIVIKDNSISGWGGKAIQCSFCSQFKIINNYIANAYEMGIEIDSGKFGIIAGNEINGINGDGVLGTEAWGIALTKNTGSEAVYPVSHDILVDHNIIREVHTWQAYDTHGGYNLTFSNNECYNCRRAFHIGSYINTAGSRRGPTNVIIIGNRSHVDNSVIAQTDVAHGIIVTGDTANLGGAGNGLAQGNIIANNIFIGHGDSDVAVGSGEVIEVQYSDNTVIVGNIIEDSGRHGIGVYSCLNIQIKDNLIKNLAGTAPVKATGTITFSGGVPVADETVTVNGLVFTFKAAAVNFNEVTIGGDAATTASNFISKFNAATDGRVMLVTASSGGSGIVTLTYDVGGRNGNFVTLAEAATNVTVSGATLSGGAAGTSGMYFKQLSASGIDSTGTVENNQIEVGSSDYTGIYMDDDNTSLHFNNNRLLGSVGQLYDMQGSGSDPQSGAGDIVSYAIVKATRNLSNIPADNSEDFRVPVNGLGSSDHWSVTLLGTSNALNGLVVAARPEQNRIRVQVYNPGAGAQNLDSMTWYFRVDKTRGSAVVVSD